MNKVTSSSKEALILAPTDSDGPMAAQVLIAAGISARVCTDISDLCARIQLGCGTVIISEEALTHEATQLLQKTLEHQENWSDLPIILLTSADVVSATELFTQSGNISLLERPFSKLTLIRSTEVALRARSKQYEVRDLVLKLRLSKEEADRANIAKSQFLANMSHEIRTPIGAIMGFIDLMKNLENQNSEEAFQYMGIIDRNSQQLLRLIDDILDLSKVEAGKMPIEHIQFDLSEFLTDLISNFNFKASAKGLTFQAHLNSKIPNKIKSDPGRLRQILTNIVGNAIKFTSQGNVQLIISYQVPYLQFAVIDTGVGLSQAQIPKLFQPFAQADTSTTRKYGGTGLGLALSRRLSEALGGSLDLKTSEPGVGSTFEFKIKVEQLENSEMISLEELYAPFVNDTSVNSHKALQGLKVLLVEDSVDIQTLVSLYLQNSGAMIEVRSNGAEGMRAALQSNYDLILMDVQMPVMDGLVATQKLRSQKYAKPIIALTAHAMSEEKKKCLAAGFTDYLTKPIQRHHLIDTLSSYRTYQ